MIMCSCWTGKLHYSAPRTNLTKIRTAVRIVPPGPGSAEMVMPDPSLAVCSHVYVNEVLSLKCVLNSQPYFNFRNVISTDISFYWFICLIVLVALYG